MTAKRSPLALLILLFIALFIPLLSFIPRSDDKQDAWAYVPERLPHTDHSSLMTEPLSSGQDVTKKCLECHEDAAGQVMQSAHWTWTSPPVLLPGRTQSLVLGKKNAVNNFCIGIQSNWPACTSCHAGYGWVDATFDFSISEN
ncbi:cytochrome C, partial [candidate division KSB1 bacterium]